VTEYNGTKILNGSNASGLDFHVGIAGSANDVITLKTVNATTAGATGPSAAAFTTAARSAWVTSMTTGAAAGDLNQAWILANQAALASGATAEMADRATFALEEMFYVGFYEAGGTRPPGPGAALDAGVALVQQAASSAGGNSPLLTQMFQAYADALTAGGGDTQAAIDAVRSFALPVGVDSGAAFDGANAAYDAFKASFLAAGGDPLFQSGDLVTLGSPEVQAGLAALTGGGVGVGGGGSATGGLGVTGLSLASKSSALSALGTLDAAIATLSSTRAELGASGNRLQSAIANIQAFSESLSAANSRIKDVDVAEETSRMARSQILSQAGVSVLAQANQMPQLALKLLG
jgi:flagellin-like hook-associated protein FlgL